MYVEFPELTPEAKAACAAAHPSIPYPNNFNRQSLSAFLREAMKQSDPVAPVGRWGYLEAIANNLHNPAPLPPTQKQMNAILQDLNAAFGDQIGPDWTLNPFEALQRGIAYYCKEQP